MALCFGLSTDSRSGEGEKKREGERDERERKACPFYQYKLKKIKPARGPRFLSGDVSGPLNKGNIWEEHRGAWKPVRACACVQMNVSWCAMAWDKT